MVSVNAPKELQNILPKGNPLSSILCYSEFTFVSLCLGVFVLNLSCFSLLSSVPLWLICIAFPFAFSAAFSRPFAATAWHRRRGSHTGANRGAQWHQPNQPPHKNVNSAPCSLTAACQFSGKYAKDATTATFKILFSG